MLKNVPVVLDGYKLRVTEEPVAKTYTNDTGGTEVAFDMNGAQLFVASLLMKQRPSEGRRAGKGFEVKVTLETDPSGEEIEEGQLVELIQPRISQWSMNGREGVSLRATGIKVAG